MEVTSESIIEIIKEAEVSSCNPANLKVDVSLYNQGIDSLETASIFLLIEEKFNVKVPDKDLDQLDTIEKIVNYIKGKSPKV